MALGAILRLKTFSGERGQYFSLKKWKISKMLKTILNTEKSDFCPFLENSYFCHAIVLLWWYDTMWEKAHFVKLGSSFQGFLIRQVWTFWWVWELSTTFLSRVNILPILGNGRGQKPRAPPFKNFPPGELSYSCSFYTTYL